MRILFDSKKEEHKTPFGCLREGECCTLRLHTPDVCGAIGVTLLVSGEGGFSLSVTMTRERISPPYTVYSTTFTLPHAGLYFYYFRVQTPSGAFSLYKTGDTTNMEAGDVWQISCLPRDFHTPEDFRGAVYYQIFPDRFYHEALCDTEEKKTPFTLHESTNEEPEYRPNSEGRILNCDFFGGNLRGITAKLPYLASLSVSVIYLNPIFAAASNHRYDTADYRKIDPLLGTEEDFSALCRAAHALGMRVILDGVFSHTGADSLYFDREGRYEGGAYRNPDSPYRAWYQFEQYPEKYAAWWGIDTLPATNELCPSFLDFIIRDEDSVVAHWLRAGADGFRLDVADELPDEFIALLRARVKEINPRALVLGEVWEDASNKVSYGVRRRYFTGSELDSVMNYPFRDAILGFVRGDIPAQTLRERVLTICENYPREVLPCLMNSLSTHDTPRALTLLSDIPTPPSREERAHARLTGKARERAISRLRAAVFLQFTLPGSPCIYYGDEVGAEGYEDPFCRRYFPWDTMDGEILDFHRTIAALRQKTDALRLGDTEIDTPNEYTVFLRRTYEKKTVLCILTRNGITIPKGKVLLSFGEEAGALAPLGFAILEV